MARPDMPKVSLGDFRIGRVQALVRENPYHPLIEVCVVLEGLRDRAAPKQATTGTLLEQVPMYAWEQMTAKDRHTIIRGAVRRALEHEIDEWMEVDGERFTDPHAADTDDGA